MNAGAVQFADNMPLHRMEATDLKRLRSRAEECGITIEAGTKGIQPELLLEYLRIAKNLGSEIVRTLVYSESGKLEVAQSVTLLERVLPEYERENVSLAIENYQLYSSSEYRTIMTSLRSDHAGICLDPVNNFGKLETPEQVVKELGEFVINLHYKDFTIDRIESTMGYRITGAPAGRGALNAEWLLETIQAPGRCRSVIIEQWVPFRGSLEATIEQELEWAEAGAKYLQKTMKDMGILEP